MLLIKGNVSETELYEREREREWDYQKERYKETFHSVSSYAGCARHEALVFVQKYTEICVICQDF